MILIQIWINPYTRPGAFAPRLTKLPKAPKHRYSRKVKGLGYGIILLEIATVVLLFVAVYSNARVVASVASSLSTISGNGFGLQNYTDTSNGQIERAFVIPDITNNGYVPVTLSINANFLDSQSQSVGTPLRQSITIAPGQMQPLVLPTTLSGSSAISGVHLSVDISSLSGLVGGGLSVTYTK